MAASRSPRNAKGRFHGEGPNDGNEHGASGGPCGTTYGAGDSGRDIKFPDGLQDPFASPQGPAALGSADCDPCVDPWSGVGILGEQAPLLEHPCVAFSGDQGYPGFGPALIVAGEAAGDDDGVSFAGCDIGCAAPGGARIKG